MTTIPLTEALSRATKGPLKSEPHALGFRCYVLPDGGNDTENCIITVQGISTEEVMANAALLAHCRNELPNLDSAVRKYLTVKDNYDSLYAPSSRLTDDCSFALDQLREALARAQNVKMP